ncbi:MAG: hypothetical protein WC575_03390 [Patescibacteria group bacterium]
MATNGCITYRLDDGTIKQIVTYCDGYEFSMSLIKEFGENTLTPCLIEKVIRELISVREKRTVDERLIIRKLKSPNERFSDPLDANGQIDEHVITIDFLEKKIEISESCQNYGDMS